MQVISHSMPNPTACTGPCWSAPRCLLPKATGQRPTDATIRCVFSMTSSFAREVEHRHASLWHHITCCFANRKSLDLLPFKRMCAAGRDTRSSRCRPSLALLSRLVGTISPVSCFCIVPCFRHNGWYFTSSHPIPRPWLENAPCWLSYSSFPPSTGVPAFSRVTLFLKVVFRGYKSRLSAGWSYLQMCLRYGMEVTRYDKKEEDIIPAFNKVLEAIAPFDTTLRLIL